MGFPVELAVGAGNPSMAAVSKRVPLADEDREGEEYLQPVLTPEEKARAARAQLILLVIMALFIITPFVVWLFIMFRR
jgi:hypothetical protein